jgi:FlaA1/EpsC-like NDP-sugar epimerase
VHSPLERTTMPAPKIAAPLTNTLRHDVYTEISPVGDLAGSAVGLVVVVTGAGRGVGRAQAITFAQAGAKRVVIAARSTHELREVEEEIKRLGGTTEVTKVHVDVTDPASVERLFAQVPDVNGATMPCCFPLLSAHKDD